MLAVGVVLLLIAGAAWWALSSLDFLVKSALEHYGPQLLGVSVKVADVEISTKSGRGRVRGLDIGNPAGFASRRSIRVSEATLAVDVGSLARDVVVIREISVEAPEITYELVGGSANLDVIQRNIEASQKRTVSSAGATSSGKASGERRYIIHAANIRKARIKVTNPLLKGGGLTFTLPDIELRDLGKSSNGVTAGEATRIITAVLISRIAARALSSRQLLERGAGGAKDLLRELFRPQ